MGLSDLGGAVTWGEGLSLLESAAADPSTALGAELAGWAYPASMPTLIQIAAAIGNPRRARRVMPWTLGAEKAAKPTSEEVAQATAALEEGIVFS